jgi:hypothetical protein
LINRMAKGGCVEKASRDAFARVAFDRQGVDGRRFERRVTLLREVIRERSAQVTNDAPRMVHVSLVYPIDPLATGVEAHRTFDTAVPTLGMCSIALSARYTLRNLAYHLPDIVRQRGIASLFGLAVVVLVVGEIACRVLNARARLDQRGSPVAAIAALVGLSAKRHAGRALTVGLSRERRHWPIEDRVHLCEALMGAIQKHFPDFTGRRSCFAR